MTRPPRSAIREWPLRWQYAFSLGLVALGVVARLPFDRVLGDSVPFLVLFAVLLPLVVLVRPGPFMLAALAGGLAVLYLYAPPRFGLTISGRSAAQAAMFMLAVIGAAVTAWIVEQKHVSTSRAADLLRAFVDDSPACAMVTGPGGTIRYANRAVAELLGKRVEEVVGRTLGDLLAPEQARLAQAGIDAVSRAGRAAESVESFGGGAGGPRQLEWTRFPLRFRAAAEPLIAAIGIDVTERISAEAALRAGEAQLRAKAEELRTILDIVPVQIWFGDAQCSDFRGNAAAYEAHGLPRGINASFEAAARELPAGFHLEVDGRELTPAEMPMQVAARTGRKIERFEHEVVRADGRRQTMWANAAPLFNPDGTVRGVVGAYIDITERKSLEHSLRCSEARLKSILEQLPVAVGVMDRAGEWTLTNPLMDAIGRGGLAADDPAPRWRGWNAEGGVLPPEDWPCRRALRGERGPGADLLYTDDDGRERWMRVNAAPLVDAQGDTIGATCVVQDIDLARRFSHRLREELAKRTREVAQAAQSLARSERLAAVGTMAAGLAHDIGNITMPLGARLDVLLHDGATPEPVKRELAVITALVDHLRNMSRNLMLFSRDPAHEGADGTTDLASWWRGVGGLVESSISRGGRPGDSRIRLEADLPQGLPKVAVAPHRLTQAVLNLVHNARDAIDAGLGEHPPGREIGTISIRARADGECVLFSVIDDGPGMDDEVRARAIEPFFTTRHRPASAGEPGSGLGLSLVHAICQRIGAALDIRSAPGQGATVTIRLRAEPARAGDDPAGGGAAPGTLSRPGRS